MELGVVCVHVCVWAGKVARAASSSVHPCMHVPVGRLLRGILPIDGPDSATAFTALTLLGGPPSCVSTSDQKVAGRFEGLSTS